MARVIEIDKSKEKQVTHTQCGAVVGYYLNEIQNRLEKDYGGGSELVYYIICPNCGKEIRNLKHY